MIPTNTIPKHPTLDFVIFVSNYNQISLCHYAQSQLQQYNTILNTKAHATDVTHALHIIIQ